MNVADLLVALRREANDRVYVRRLEILDRSSILRHGSFLTKSSLQLDVDWKSTSNTKSALKRAKDLV